MLNKLFWVIIGDVATYKSYLTVYSINFINVKSENLNENLLELNYNIITFLFHSLISKIEKFT